MHRGKANEVRERGQQIGQEMLQMLGFISSANMAIGNRLITKTAWEDAESSRRLTGRALTKELDRFTGVCGGCGPQR